MAQPNKQNTKFQEWVLTLAESSAVADQGAVGGLSLSKEQRKAKRDAKRKCRKQEQLTLLHKKQKRSLDNHEAMSLSTSASLDRTERNRNLLMKIMERFASKESVGQTRQRKRLFLGDNKSNHRKRNWDERGIQPRPRDYGGIGLARPSLFLAFDDPSWAPKLEQEFAEHIQGFFGKQRTKAIKKQTNATMLWKKLLDEKRKAGHGVECNRRASGKSKKLQSHIHGEQRIARILNDV
ncbi:hypothetical protein ACA910_005296 [Epithemia clementina (nom. ined.)]